MIKSSPTDLPPQNNYQIALEEARTALAGLDSVSVAKRSGCDLLDTDGNRAFLVPCIGDEIIVTISDGIITYKNREGAVPLWLAILTLHYLVHASGAAPAGELITFQQTEGGLGYYPAFQNRSINPLLDFFKDDFDRLVRAGESLGGKRTADGDFSLSFSVFPRIEVRYVLWRGDDEFPPSGSVLFDASITDYLPTEDIAVLCGMLAVMMIRKSSAIAR